MTSKETSNRQQDSVQELDLDLYLRALYRGRKTIYKAIAIMLSLIIMYLFLVAPKYESNILLQSNPAGAGFQVGSSESSQQLVTANDEVPAVIEILTSRRVVGRVVNELFLDIYARPNFFPVIGAPISRFIDLFDDDTDDLRSPVLGIQGFAWGGERITVEQFEVPKYFEDTDFLMIAGENGKYEIFDEEENIIIEGTVGELSSGRVKVADGSEKSISILVTELVARTGTKFSVTKLPWTTVVEDMREEMEALEVSASSSIVELSLEGSDPMLISRILDAVARVYIDESINKNLAKVDRMLEFIDNQLPKIKNYVKAAEEQLSQYHREYGSVAVELQTNALLDQVAEQDKQVLSLELLLVEYENNYTKEHPKLVSLKDQIKQLHKEKEKLNSELDKLPESEIKSVNVQRNVDIASQIYLLLLQTKAELSITKAAVSSDIWVVDKAQVPIKSSGPAYLILPFLGIFLGSFIGVVLVLFRRHNVDVISFPEAMDQFRIPVLATVTHSSAQQKMEKMAVRKKSFINCCLAEYAPQDQAIRGLRDLRTSLLASAKPLDSGTFVIFSLLPGSGQSFISLNLMYLFAQLGKNVVVIDTNSQEGSLHKLLDMDRDPGLSNVVLENLDLGDALQRVGGGGKIIPGTMSLLSAGYIVDDATQVLIADRFKQTIDALKQQFDIVIISTPSVLGLANSSLIAKLAEGRNLLVVRSGQLVPEQMGFSLRHFEQGGTKFESVVFNDLPESAEFG